MQDAWAAITGAAVALESEAVRSGMQAFRTRVHGVDAVVCRARPVGRLTRLHLFMVVGAFAPGWARTDILDGFMAEAVDASIRSKGGLVRGAQTGTATIAVALTDQVTPDAQGWATKQRRTRYAAIGYPVTVELASGRVTRPDRMLIGAVYSKALKTFVSEHVTDVLYPAAR